MADKRQAVKGRKAAFEGAAAKFLDTSFTPKGGEDPEKDEERMPKWAPNLELPAGAK